MRRSVKRFSRAGLQGLAVVLCLIINSASAAENWTRFRGPNGRGIAADVNFPATWTEDDYLWKVDLTGVGHGSPVGWENRLFVTCGSADQQSTGLLCLNAETGEQLWRRDDPCGEYSMHAGNSYASTTPTLDDQRVYHTWCTSGSMHCAALTHDGKEVWTTQLGEFVGPHGFAASPMIVEGVLCLQVDHADSGYLVGIDAASGDVKWRVERPAGKASYATPCAIMGYGSPTVVVSQSMEGGLQLIEVHSGEVVWQNSEAFPARCVSSPMLVGDTLISICGGGGRGKLLVGMDMSGSLQQPVEKLTLTKQLPYVPTPLQVGEQVLLWSDQGTVSMLDLGDADPPKKAKWTERVGGKFFGSPVRAGDKIYCLSMDGRAVVIAASKEFELLGDIDLGQPSNATPAVHQGRMYLRTESSLACLGQE